MVRGVAALVLCVAAALASAAEKPYTKAAFDQAVSAGQPVVLDVQASWCPTCKAQRPIVDALMKEPARRNVTLFRADFDTESALKRQLRVAQQSTFVVFKGGKEVGRSTGETRKEAIAALFDKAL
jgi:thioredoxin-like negative regulator of GroEL